MSFIALAVATASVATTVSVPTTPVKQTLQQQFDSATELYQSGKCLDSVEAFKALDARVNPVRMPSVSGAIRARMGHCYYLLGNFDAARPVLESAAKLLPAGDANFRNDRLETETSIGALDNNALRPSDAVVHFTAAMANAETPSEKARTHMALAQARMFIDPLTAQADADEALRIASETSGTSKETLGKIRTLRGRVMMNRGMFDAAYAELRKSVTEQGGLTMKVTLSDIISRSDLAIAALMTGDKDSARKYLAYTGAGRFEKAPFATARRASPPPCGGPGELRPEDSAIVQFSVDDNGATRFVEPIWASRPGPVAIAFARAVQGWSWSPEEVAAIPSFFRVVTRVELRCSNAASRPSAWASLDDSMSEWLVQRGAPEIESNEPDATALPKLLAELENREKSGDPVKELPVLIALMKNAVATAKQQEAWRNRALAIALQAKAPIAVETRLRVSAARVETVNDARRIADPLLADPRYASDPLIADTLRLAVADMAPTDNSAAMIAQLTAVADDTRLPSKHPLRVAALVRLADRYAAKGDMASAQGSYARTGLNDAQCALVGSAPSMQSFSGSFPQEAQAWGFEGWVKLETDVASDGHTLNQRVVMAYPPFVFRDATLKAARTMRFNKTYRPSGDAACSAYQRTVRFSIQK